MYVPCLSIIMSMFIYCNFRHEASHRIPIHLITRQSSLFLVYSEHNICGERCVRLAWKCCETEVILVSPDNAGPCLVSPCVCIFICSLVNSFEAVAGNLANQDRNVMYQAVEETVSLQVLRVSIFLWLYIFHQWYLIYLIGEPDETTRERENVHYS